MKNRRIVKALACFLCAALIGTGARIPVLGAEAGEVVSGPAVETEEGDLSAEPINDPESFEPEKALQEDAGTVTEYLPEDLDATGATGFKPLTFIRVEDGFFDEDTIGVDSTALGGAQYADSYWDQFAGYYFYNQLNDKEKKLYDNLYASCEKAMNGTADYTKVGYTYNLKYKDGHQEAVNFYALPAAAYSGLSAERLQEIIWFFIFENPQFYFVSNYIAWDTGNAYIMCFPDFNTGAERSKATSDMKKKLDSWVSQVKAKSSDLEKEAAAFEILCKEVEYNDANIGDDLNQCAWSCIVRGLTVCSGYARSLSMLLNAAGIDSAVVTSSSHAWTMARVYGTWYYLDATYADQSWGVDWSQFNRSAKGGGMSDSAHSPEAMYRSYLPTMTTDSGGKKAAKDPLGTVPDPVITETKSGSDYEVTIKCSDSNAAIYYTTGKSDVPDPGSSYSKSTKYTGSFKVKSGVTVKARAERINYTDSKVVSASDGNSSGGEDPEEEEEGGAVTGVSLDNTKIVMSPGETKSLTSTVKPSKADDMSVEWSYESSPTGLFSKTQYSTSTSSPTSTYTFTAGNKTGTATITVKTKDGGKTASCQVIVAEYNWNVSSKVADKNGSYTISAYCNCTDSVEYDGRKHVVGNVPGKTVKATSSVNPDIEVKDFGIELNGKAIPGVTVSSYTYKNNQLPSNDGVTNQSMYVFPVLKYDSKNAELKALLKENPKLRQSLNALVKPSFSSKTKTWSSQPITVTITRIDLTDVKVYTKAELSASAALQKTDGILVWNGDFSKDLKVTYDKKTGYITKATLQGFYYQKVFKTSDGKTVVKKINLRPGGWKVKNGAEVMASTSFDYYPVANQIKGQSKTLGMKINGNDADWSGQNAKAKRGNFTGSFPYISKK